MVSAIIITHNRCGLLKKAVQSVKNQTFRDIELIVVDDASTDETESVCRSMKDIIYIRISPEDSKGGDHARNIGIERSKGEYIAFLDDDDYWEAEKIEYQVKALEKYPKAGLVYTATQIVPEKEKWSFPAYCDERAVGDLAAKKMYGKPVWFTSTMMVRRSVVEAAGGFDEELFFWQDYEYFLRLIQHCNVAMINYPFVRYRKNIGDKARMSNQYDSWLEAVGYIWKKHKNFFALLDEQGRRDRMEHFLVDGAYRCAAVGDKRQMRRYFLKAFQLTNRKKYLLRAVLGLSNQDTVHLEIFVKKTRNMLHKRKASKEAVFET